MTSLDQLADALNETGIANARLEATCFLDENPDASNRPVEENVTASLADRFGPEL